jgi:alpha-L-rhamnosidase
VTLNLTLPANTTASVHVPARAASDVTVDGEAINEADHVTMLGMEEGRAVLNVGSGRYRIVSTMQ